MADHTYTAYVYRGHDQSEQPLTIYNVVGFQTAPHGVSITCERHDDAGDHEATYSIKHSGFARIILAASGSPPCPCPADGMCMGLATDPKDCRVEAASHGRTTTP